jgi:hypothetical protein
LILAWVCTYKTEFSEICIARQLVKEEFSSDCFPLLLLIRYLCEAKGGSAGIEGVLFLILVKKGWGKKK